MRLPCVALAMKEALEGDYPRNPCGYDGILSWLLKNQRTNEDLTLVYMVLPYLFFLHMSTRKTIFSDTLDIGYGDDTGLSWANPLNTTIVTLRSYDVRGVSK